MPQKNLISTKKYLAKGDRKIIENFFRNWRPVQVKILSEFVPGMNYGDRIKFDSEKLVDHSSDKKLILDIEFAPKPASDASLRKTDDKRDFRIFEMNDIDNEVYLEKRNGFDPELAIATVIKQDDPLTDEERKILGLYADQIRKK